MLISEDTCIFNSCLLILFALIWENELFFLFLFSPQWLNYAELRDSVGLKLCVIKAFVFGWSDIDLKATKRMSFLFLAHSLPHPLTQFDCDKKKL